MNVSCGDEMGKTKTFRVIKNRLQFRCLNCGAKRTFAIPPHLRGRNIRCHKCGEITKCSFNRRVTLRELQSGKAVLITDQGIEVDIFLTDMSIKGIGFELPVRAARARVIKIGDQVRLSCRWNRRLLSGSRFVVQNINGQRVGVKKVDGGLL